MGVFLGVDGGGTKTVAVVVDDRGEILALCKGETTNPEWIGDSAGQRAREIVESALDSAGIRGSDVDYAYLGMAGVNSVEPDAPERIMFVRALESLVIPCGKVTVDNDSYVGLACALGHNPGVAVVAGSGFNAIGIGAGGVRKRVPWYVAGRGAGQILGRQTAMAALFGMAGACGATRIPSKVLDILGIGTIDGLLDWLSELNGGENIGKLTRVLTEAADEGDAVAVDMLRTAGMEFGLAAVLVARSLGLGMDGTVCPVAIIGGVFKAGIWVTDPMVQVMSGCGINASLVRPVFPPAFGAVFLAWHRAGCAIGRDMVERLQVCYERFGEAAAVDSQRCPSVSGDLSWIFGRG